MTSHASYILNGYSFIHSLPKEYVCKVGSHDADGHPIPSFDEELLINLCKDAEMIFKKEESILEIEGDAIVVGDIHGSFHDLLRILTYIDSNKSKVIFLGDYVDRGEFSLECITLLFALKVLNPNTYFLLRGNHEFDAMCSQYGFKKEILNYHNPKKVSIIKNNEEKIITNDTISFNFEEEEEKEEEDIVSNEALCDDYFANHINMNCYKYSERLYNAFIKAFSYLPIASIINKTSICLHGGLTHLLDKVENIQKQIQRPINDFDENLLLSDITWSDPSAEIEHFYGANQRGRGQLFNGAVVVNFLKNNSLKRIIRGHECVSQGVLELFNDKCITVFSASSYCHDMGNCSGILKINQKDDTVEPIYFPPLHRLKKYDAIYFKVQSFFQTQTNKSMFSVCNKKITEYKSGFFPSFLNLGNIYSDTNNRSTNHQISLKEMSKLGRGFINSSIGRKSKSLAMKTLSLRSGPRKKIYMSNSNLIAKSPQIVAPIKVTQHSSQIIYETRKKPIIDIVNDGISDNDKYNDNNNNNIDILLEMQM